MRRERLLLTAFKHFFKDSLLFFFLAILVAKVLTCKIQSNLETLFFFFSSKLKNKKNNNNNEKNQESKLKAKRVGWVNETNQEKT